MRGLVRWAVDLTRRLRRGAEDRAGQAMIEYALIISLIVIVVLVVLIVLGNTVKNTYCNIESAVVSA
jgi:Flp pilus assembly pilin Flp